MATLDLPPGVTLTPGRASRGGELVVHLRVDPTPFRLAVEQVAAAMRRLGEAFSKPWQRDIARRLRRAQADVDAEKRARKARSRQLRYSLPAHRR